LSSSLPEGLRGSLRPRVGRRLIAEKKLAILARFSAESLDTLLATRPFHGVEVKLRGEHKAHSTFLLSAGPLVDENKATVGSIVTLTPYTKHFIIRLDERYRLYWCPGQILSCPRVQQKKSAMVSNTKAMFPI
jgi:hypothetical protein